MLVSLGIRNFVLIEDASLDVAQGLTCLTGETGAGKTLLTQALGLLRGERAEDGLVGEGGDDALIEAVFEVSAGEVDTLPRETVELAGLAPGELVATRRLHRSGRNRCFLNGVSVTLGVLGDVVGGLVSFSGQHEHRRLLEPDYQRVVLDAFAGPAVAGVREEYGAAWAEAREAGRLLADQETSRAQSAQERELLGFQVAELETAALSVSEEEALVVEQRVLARAEELVLRALEAAECLRSDGEGAAASSLLAQARGRLGSVAGVDPAIDEVLVSLEEAAYAVDEAARGLRSYADRVVVDPGRLASVEERLRTYADLARKYGGSTASAVEHLRAGRERLGALEAAADDMADLVRRRDAAGSRSLELAGRLTTLRREAAPHLQRAIEQQLTDLGMPETRVAVQISSTEGFALLSQAGADTVEFLLAPNPGLPLRPLARTASGGELSRTLLAIKAALAGLERPETLVFDEIDAGIGGRTATAVGRKLWQISRDCQAVVVTHLAQVAAYAERHYLIDKQVQEGQTVTRLVALDAAASLEELSRMMGGEPADPGALAHARTLRDRARSGLID